MGLRIFSLRFCQWTFRWLPHLGCVTRCTHFQGVSPKAEDERGAAKGGSWPGSRVLRAEALPGFPLQDFVMRQKGQPSLQSPRSPDATSKLGGVSPRGGPGPRRPLLPSQRWSPLCPADPALQSSGKEGGLAGRRQASREVVTRPCGPRAWRAKLGAVESGAQAGALGSGHTVGGGVLTPETQSPQQ